MPERQSCLNGYFAHSLSECDINTWQLLEDHLSQVSEDAGRFASVFDSENWGRTIGVLHDIGKADPDWQQYLRDVTSYSISAEEGVKKYHSKVNHSEAGTAWVFENYPSMPGQTLAYLIAGHHAGLPDWRGDGKHVKASLLARKPNCVKALQELLQKNPNVQTWLESFDGSCLSPPRLFKITHENYHYWVRMLFSCLVDADWLDTERFCQPKQAVKRTGFDTLPVLKEKFDRYMAGFVVGTQRETNDEQERGVFSAREQVLKACLAAGRAGNDKGIYSLTVPTGGGKTLSSMAFALEKAIHQGKSRIIYVIPYTSIIEQNAVVFRSIFGPNNLVEHHSNLDREQLNLDWSQEEVELDRLELASENWDAPIIVTTNVQFFESMFAAKCKRCRKLHNIVNSVVILDEAQMLEPTLLAPCVDVLNKLVEDFKVTLVLCTATQPALSQLKEIKKSCPALKEATPIEPDTEHLYNKLNRVTYHFDDNNEKRTWSELAEELQGYPQVLCIVNTRRDCYDLYQEMGGQGGSSLIHLSALMCGHHRTRVIDHIRQKLQNGEEVRVISTQLVEAGVDIDFPVVYRAMTGLDSIAQAAGRCNREGKLGPGGGHVYVFNPPKQSPQGLLQKAEKATKEMIAAGLACPERHESFAEYFKLFYSSLNNIGDDWLRELTVHCPEIPFRTAAEEFKLIDDSYTDAVLVWYESSSELVERLRWEGPSRDLMRKLQRYTVNIPKKEVERLVNELKLEVLESGLIVQRDISLYDDCIGVDLFGTSSVFVEI